MTKTANFIYRPAQVGQGGRLGSEAVTSRWITQILEFYSVSGIGQRVKKSLPTPISAGVEWCVGMRTKRIIGVVRHWVTCSGALFLSAVLLFLAQNQARADEIDIGGKRQVNLTCPASVSATNFIDISENVATGEVQVVQVPPLVSSCGTVFAADAIRRISSCTITPSPTIGQVSGTDLDIPVTGSYMVDVTFETPFLWPLVGCSGPPVARGTLQARVDGTIADGTPVRITGTMTNTEATLFDTLGEVCGGFAQESCTFIMLPNEVGVGVDQGVQPLDGATLTFETVTLARTASITPLTEPDGELPGNFQHLGTPIYFDVATTATISGIVTVCLPYTDADNDGIVDGSSPPIDENTVQILHEQGGVFVDRTVSRDAVDNQVCAEVTALSQFVLGRGAVAVPSVTRPGLILFAALLLGTSILLLRNRLRSRI